MQAIPRIDHPHRPHLYSGVSGDSRPRGDERVAAGKDSESETETGAVSSRGNTRVPVRVNGSACVRVRGV